MVRVTALTLETDLHWDHLRLRGHRTHGGCFVGPSLQISPHKFVQTDFGYLHLVPFRTDYAIGTEVLE